MTALLRFILMLLLLKSTIVAQNASMQVTYGSNNQMVDHLMDFEGITAMNVKFIGQVIQGKYYQIISSEYKNKKLVKSVMLFDGTEVDVFKIDSDTMEFNVFAKFEEKTLKVQVRADRFSSKKTFLKLYNNKYNYALKDFIPSAKAVEVSIAEPIYILGVITPSVHQDGSTSYCEVAYSKINPKDFGSHYNIPHYFLIQVVFKNKPGQ